MDVTNNSPATPNLLPQPPDLLAQHRLDIATTWAGLIRDLPAPPYPEHSAADLRDQALALLDTMVQASRTGQPDMLDDYIQAVCADRVRQGHSIGEIIEGLALLRDAMIRTVAPGCGAGTATESVPREVDAVARDLIRRFADLYAGMMEQQLHEEQSRTALMLDATQGASSSLNLDPVLPRLAAAMAAAVRVPYCGIYLLNAERGLLILRSDTGNATGAGLATALAPELDPHADSRVCEVVEQRQPVTWRAGGAVAAGPLPAGPAGFTAILAVPIKLGERVLGMAVLAALDPAQQFTPAEIALAVGIANASALAIETARLHIRSERLAIVEERQRIARELHDSAAQSLYTISLYADAARMALTAGKTDTSLQHLSELRECAQDALREMRLLIFELRPHELENRSLELAIRSRLEAVEAHAGLQTELVVEGEGHLPIAVEEELYRIAQEALNNATRHSHGRKILVHLQLSAQHVLLEVRDDGEGFVLSQAGGHGGMGLAGLRERARKIGGHLQIESAPGAGTAIRVEVEIGSRLEKERLFSLAHERSPA